MTSFFDKIPGNSNLRKKELIVVSQFALFPIMGRKHADNSASSSGKGSRWTYKQKIKERMLGAPLAFSFLFSLGL